MPSQAEVQANLERCPRFETCNRNKCPLDAELHLRYGGAVCLWMQAGDGQPIKRGAVTMAYVRGAVMPDELLIHVPQNNVSQLNGRSQARWQELHAQTDSENEREGPRSPLTTGELGSDKKSSPEETVAV